MQTEEAVMMIMTTMTRNTMTMMRRITMKRIQMMTIINPSLKTHCFHWRGSSTIQYFSTVWNHCLLQD
jgi:hypothetical protein